jgi:hypothetical protein
VPVASLVTHTAAVIAALQAAGVAVGDGSGKGLSPPFAVVYPIPGGGTSGTLGKRNEDAELVYQVTCVGRVRPEAEWIVDKVMALLNGFNVAGRSILLVSLDSHGGIRRDDDVTPPLFYATPRFRVLSVPA